MDKVKRTLDCLLHPKRCLGLDDGDDKKPPEEKPEEPPPEHACPVRRPEEFPLGTIYADSLRTDPPLFRYTLVISR